MKNKKFGLLALSLVGLLGLTACNNEIVAKPSTYEAPLIVVNGYTQEIYHNLESIVDDKIHDNGIGSDVLNQILYLYAVSAFGAYDRTVVAGGVPVGADEVTLADALINADNMNKFVKTHKTYWDKTRTDATADASLTEVERVKAKSNTIEERIAEVMYEKISGGSYSDRHLFYESRFISSLKSTLDSVANQEQVAKFDGVQILPLYEPKDVFGNEELQFAGYLHRENYQSVENTYIVDKVLPDIYRNLLSELYLNTETPNTLGRSYARKVNIIKFANNSNYPNAADLLANSLVSRINDAPTLYNIQDMLSTFKLYSRAYTGVVTPGSDEAAILNHLQFKTGNNDDTGTYWLGTSYGDLAEKYVKVVNNDPSAKGDESSFTDSGKYPVYVGLDQQKKALEENDNTQNGWFIKNGGLTDLPEEIRSRLFNIAVATGVKETVEARNAAERKFDPLTGKWSEAEDENAYVCRINGHNFLKKAQRVRGDEITKDILHYDSSSKTYYIIEIEEAVSSSKLSEQSSTNYARTRGADVMEKFINEVGEVVAKGGSYSTLATKKYLKDMVIAYHDDSVYNYFLSNYPELFE